MHAVAVDRFIQDLVQDYHAARDLLHRRERVSRGVARIVSSLAEERFANCLADSYRKIDHIYVDQQLRFEDPEQADKWQVHQPDLVVRVGHEIRLLVDLKMDLGRLRDKLPSLASNASQLLQTQGAKFCRTHVRDEPGLRRIQRGLVLSPRCEYVLLVISGTNIPKGQLAEMVKAASGFGSVHVVVLWPGEHPNHQKRTAAAAVERLRKTIDTGALRALHAIVQRCVEGGGVDGR